MYTWVLRDKGSEWRALEAFVRTNRGSLTPLIEGVCEPFIEGDPRRQAISPIQGMRNLGTKLANLSQLPRVWFDLSNLLHIATPADVARFHAELSRTVGNGCQTLTPVVRTDSPSELLEAAVTWARANESGICFRVMGPLGARTGSLPKLARWAGLSERDIDVVYDAQDVPLALSHEELADLIPFAQEAREYVKVAGKFPRSITELSVDEYEHSFLREEWSEWLAQLEAGGTFRHPDYGDYATQPSVYHVSPSFAGSPSLRYTTDSHFVVLRGRGGSKGKPMDFGQYVGHARYLRSRPYFRSAVATSADRYIEEISEQAERTGNATTWRVASLGRHIGVAVMQVQQAVATVRR